MAEWATINPDQGLRKSKLSLDKAVLPLILGILVARGDILGLHPFGTALAAALLLRGGKGAYAGLLGIIVGGISLFDSFVAWQLFLATALLCLVIPRLRRLKHEGILLITATVAIEGLVAFLAANIGSDPDALVKLGLQSILAGGFAVVYWYALVHQEGVWRGEFQREQGIAWLMLLIGALSGLQGVVVGEINFTVVVLSFFVLFVSNRYGAGSAAGVGVLLGFLPQLAFSMQNLMNAGMYGLAGFCTGAFQRFGKIGIGVAFSGVMLVFTVFLTQEAIFSQLISSGIGLLVFLIWPGESAGHNNLPKTKPMPELEATVNKVKTVAEIFDQMALSYQAAEAEVSNARKDMSELINILVERVCRSCPTMDTCWEREFYRTYHFLFDLFVLIESQEKVKVQDLPVEWKRYCGRLKEMVLGVQFIMEHEKSQEVWRKRLALNQEALSRQFQSVSQVIGHLAKELHKRHNWMENNNSSLLRRRRHFLDIGVANFSSQGNGMSGDNYASLAFAPTQHAFILSDGMGIGESAAKLSATALTLLEQLLSTGFEPEGAIQALNSILVLRSPEESFVTIDMAILDLESDELKLIKVGASPTYIKGKDGISVFASSSLPAGILNHIEIPVVETTLGVEDVMVLVTDGIQDVLMNGTDWLKDFLDKTFCAQSQEFAEQIMQEARRLSEDGMHDDGVVLVVRKNYWDD